jgi:GNAT superfamily N-acetyltransferase
MQKTPTKILFQFLVVLIEKVPNASDFSEGVLIVNNIHIREMLENDPEIISNAFLSQGWNKSTLQYLRYFQETRDEKRAVLIAEINGEFAGYITILWESDYPPFRTDGIPEIADFNVLQKFQRQGIGSKLMETAEQYAAKYSSIVGIGVGLTPDYGSAQILYVKRGYIPDGLGISYQGLHLSHGEHTQVDDDLVLHFTKSVK